MIRFCGLIGTNPKENTMDPIARPDADQCVLELCLLPNAYMLSSLQVRRDQAIMFVDVLWEQVSLV